MLLLGGWDLPRAIAIEPETTIIAPIIAKNVRFSGLITCGAIEETKSTDIKVTIGAKAKTALTFDACQCSKASANAP